MFFCVDFMLHTMNNSLATTMFEGDSEVVPSTGADVVSSAGSSVLQAGRNISTGSDTLAQAMSRALTDSLPGILGVLRNHNVVPSQPAPPNSNPTVISTSSPAPLTQASLGQATTSGTVPDRSNLTGNTLLEREMERCGNAKGMPKFLWSWSAFRTRTRSIENAITRSIENLWLA